MLLAQHLSHLLLQGADALLCLAHLAGRFLTQLFGAFAELHTLQLSNQRLQAVDFAGVRRHPLREQTVIFRHFADGRLLLLQQRLSRAFSSGYEVSITPLYSRLYAYSRAFRPLGMLPVNAFQQHGQLRRRQVDLPSRVTGQTKRPRSSLFNGKHAQAVPVGPQYLYHVAAPAAKDEQMPAERVIP